MLGLDATYHEVPYFYSDQYELGIEYAGHVELEGDDEVILREGQTECIVFWLRKHRVLAGMNVNVWDQIDSIVEDKAVEDTAGNHLPGLWPHPLYGALAGRLA